MNSNAYNSGSDKIKALDELFLNASVYRNSDEFYKLLNFINKFRNFSPFNAFLLYNQNKGLEIAMTRSKWLRYNRTIKPLSKSYVILVPFGPVNFVYDIKDTEGDDMSLSLFEDGIPPQLTNPFNTSGDFDSHLYSLLNENCWAHSIQVEESDIVDSAAGYVRRKNNTFVITLNSKWDVKVKFSTLIHELGHIFSGHLGILEDSFWDARHSLSQNIIEIEAESISFLTCNRIGLTTNSHEYLSQYISKDKEIPNISLDTILTVSGYIEQMLSATFRPKKSSMKTNKQ